MRVLQTRNVGNSIQNEMKIYTLDGNNLQLLEESEWYNKAKYR